MAVISRPVLSVAVNVALGMNQDASVEGRKSWEPISDCMGATHTLCCPHDIKGPAAICQSVTKDRPQPGRQRHAAELEVLPAALEGDVGGQPDPPVGDLRTAQRGMHSQFTVVSKDTLLAAQENPADYKDLLVRVAGYSRLLFVELSKEPQNDIIPAERN